jgi:hypothetical protein
MGMRIQRSISEPIRPEMTWDERWRGPDAGLIACWERGREIRAAKPELAEQAARGELMILAWKGGVASKIEGVKFGTLHYLATWQGLRGEDLLIPDGDINITCSRTGQSVVFSDRQLDTTGEGVVHSHAQDILLPEQ